MPILTIGTKCKRCGCELKNGEYYLQVRQMKNVAHAHSEVCISCLGALLLEDEEFLEALAQKLLSAAKAAREKTTPHPASTGGG